MRKINIRFFLALVVSVAILAAGLYLIHHFQQGRIIRGLLWQAERSVADGKLDDGIKYYSRFLEFQPANAVVCEALGAILERKLESQPLASRNPNQAIFLYEKVLRNDPSRDDLRRKLAGFYMLPRLRRYNDAAKYLDELLAKQPSDGLLWRQRAVCHESAAKYEDALAALREAAKYPPDQTHAYELMARLQRRQLGRPSDADATIAEMVAKFPNSHETYLTRARFRLEFGQQDVKEDAERAIQLAPDNAEALLLIARVDHQRGRTNEAIAHLEKGLKLYPNDARMVRHLAWLELNTGKTDAARERLQSAIVNIPEAYDLHTALAELLIQANQIDRVEQIVAMLKSKGIPEDRILYLNARIAVQREHWIEAVAKLEAMRPAARTNPDLSAQLNLLLAHCHKQMGDSDRQREALQRVIEIDPSSAPARMAMAASLAQAGKLDDALAEYHKLVRFPTTPPIAWIEAARLTIARKLREPGGPKSWDDVEPYIAEFARRQPESVELVLTQVELKVAQQRPDEAMKLLNEARSRNKDVRLWIESIRLTELSGGIESALAMVTDAENAIGDHVELRLKKAALLLGRSHSDARRVLPTLEKSNASFSAEQQTRLQVGLAEAYYNARDYSNAKRLYRQLADQRPFDVQARAMLAEIAIWEKETPTVESMLAELRRLEPAGGGTVALLEIKLLISKAEAGDGSAADLASSKLAALAEKRPLWSAIPQLQARLAEYRKDLPAAIDAYRRAIDRGDTDLRTHYRLVRLLVDCKREKEAEAALQQVAKQASLSRDGLKQVLKDVSPLLHKLTLQGLAYQTMPRDSLDPNDHIWLGQMLWESGSRNEAIDAFRRATACGGRMPEAWIALVRSLSAAGRDADALAAIGDARKHLPPELITSTSAACYEAARRFDDALNEYHRAVDAGTDDVGMFRRYARLMVMLGKHRQAEAFFQSLVQRQPPLPTDSLAWARRHLALLTANGRTPEQYKLAMALLDRNQSELGESPDDVRARVTLLANQPNRTDGPGPRRQAIELLEKLVEGPHATSDDRFALAKLYDSERDWDKAEPLYRKVIADDPRNPTPLSHYVARLIRLDRREAAASQLLKLEALAPNSANVVALRARYHHSAGEPAKASAAVRAYLSAIDPKAPDAVTRRFAGASILEELARSPGTNRDTIRREAQAIYHELAPYRSDALIRLTALMAHFGEMSEALAMLETARGLPPGVKASATIAALRAGHATPDQCQPHAAWIQQVAKQEPNNLELQISVADLFELQQQLDKAEKRYREILRRDTNSIIVLNNLAWVMAHTKPGDEALELVQRAIALAGPISELLDTRARVFLAMGRPSAAVRDLEDAIDLGPTPVRFFHLALAQEQLANSSAARHAFAQAKRHGLDPRDLHPSDVKSFERMSKQDADSPANGN